MESNPIKVEPATGIVVERKKKINVDFFLASHSEALDISRFGEYLAQADVVVLEGLRSNDRTENMFNAVSQGEISPKEGLFLDSNIHIDDSHSAEILKHIFNTKKPVLIIDLPTGSPEEQEFFKMEKEITQTHREAEKLFFDGKFDEFIKTEKRAMDMEFEKNKKREAYILNIMPARIENLKLVYPQIKNSENPKILAHYGRAHLSLFRKAQQNGLTATRHMNSPVNVLLSEEEIMNRKFLCTEVGDYLYARMLPENIIFPVIRINLNLNNDQAMWLTRKIVDNLSLEDLQDISRKVGPVMSNPRKYEIMNELLREKKVMIPRTQDEIKKIMGSYWEIFKKVAY